MFSNQFLNLSGSHATGNQFATVVEFVRQFKEWYPTKRYFLRSPHQINMKLLGKPLIEQSNYTKRQIECETVSRSALCVRPQPASVLAPERNNSSKIIMFMEAVYKHLPCLNNDKHYAAIKKKLFHTFITHVYMLHFFLNK